MVDGWFRPVSDAPGINSCSVADAMLLIPVTNNQVVSTAVENSCSRFAGELAD